MVRKIKSNSVKESYGYSFAEMSLKNKGNNNFLYLVNLIINWDSIDDIFNSNIIKSKLGASSYSNILLFKILLLQTWYNLSDPAVEDQINDRISFIRFLGISIDSKTPDHSTISRFRKFLLNEKLYDKLFFEINRQLEDNNFLVKNGAIIDASVIQSARRPRKVIHGEIVQDRKENDITNPKESTQVDDSKVDDNKENSETIVTYSDDEDATWIIKQGKPIYGYKVHNIVNQEGYFISGHATSANVSDMNQLEKALNDSKIEKGTQVLADKGYASKKNRDLLSFLGLIDKILHKETKSLKLTEDQKIENRAISEKRYVVEQSFGLLKKHYGFSRMRYIGIDKCNLENKLKMIGLNVKKAAHKMIEILIGGTYKKNDLLPLQG